MLDYRVILKRVGYAWVIFGLLDIAIMVYCLFSGQSYSSSFNIFAIIIGIFLIRGSLGASTLVTSLSALFLTIFIGIILVVPILLPSGLLPAQARHSPASTIIQLLFMFTILALLTWTYRQMRSTAVLEARKDSGRSIARPRLAIGFGFLFVALLTLMINTLLNSPTGAKAMQLARQKLGPDYQYATQSIRVSGRHCSGIVVAWNDKEIKYIPVSWNN